MDSVKYKWVVNFSKDIVGNISDRTGNSSYCLGGEISSLLGINDIFHNLRGKRSQKSEQMAVFWNNISYSWEKFPTTYENREIFSPF